MADSSKGALAGLFVLWYGFNAYYNISNKQMLNMFAFPVTAAFLQVGVPSCTLPALKCTALTDIYCCCRC